MPTRALPFWQQAVAMSQMMPQQDKTRQHRATGRITPALMAATQTTGFGAGLLFGAILGAALIATSVAYHNGFSRMSPTLTLIDTGHDLVEAAMIGAIIGLMA